MSSDITNTILHIENGAHTGAFGRNSIPEPTENQCRAGNYKLGRIQLYGLPIAIQQPRGTYRNGIDLRAGNRWSSRMAAHYGYFSGTKGADKDHVDVFVGFYPQSEQAYVINQFIDGRFDEAKVMIAFPDEQSAKRAYLDSYERGWKGLESIVPLSISQLKWWLKHGDMSKPLRLQNIPPEGLEQMSKRVYWNNDALPYDQSLDSVLYDIRRSENGELLLDSVSVQDIIEDSEGVLLLDAMVTPYAKLQRKMEVLQGVMERTGTAVKPVSMQITDPFKQRGVANVAAVFELSDGQTVSIFLHNPDVTPQKMAPTDELISWKWLLNKRDITVVVAPERGEDLNVREVARRIMKLAEKNSAAFARANNKRAERMQNIQSLKDEIVSLEKELSDAQHELEIAKVEAENRKPEPQPETQINPNPDAEPEPEQESASQSINLAIPEDDTSKLENLSIAVREALSKAGWSGFDEGAAMTMGNYRASISDNYAGFRVEKLDSESGTWAEVGFMSLEADKTAQEIADDILLIVSSNQESIKPEADAIIPSKASEHTVSPTSEVANTELSIATPEPEANPEPEIKQQSTLEDVNKVMPLLEHFISKLQLEVMKSGMRGEEGQFFIDKFMEIAKIIQTMPKTKETDGQGSKAIAYLHYFKGSGDWYITEKDMEEEQIQAFGLAKIQEEELGYIDIETLIIHGVELDLYWKPKTIGEIQGNNESNTENQTQDQLNPVQATENNDMSDPIKSGFIAELEALKSETDINIFNSKLDEIAGRIEQAGLMEELDKELNDAADVLTRLLAEAEKGL